VFTEKGIVIRVMAGMTMFLAFKRNNSQRNLGEFRKSALLKSYEKKIPKIIQCTDKEIFTMCMVRYANEKTGNL
jgi:hypothetical protein